MKRYISINLSSKDDKLKTWFKSLGDSNGSKIVCDAIIYYEITGKYLNIGELTIISIGLPDTRKQIYIPNKGKARDIIEQWGQIDNRVSTKVKHILKMGISINDEIEENQVITEDEALAAVESVLNAHKIRSEETLQIHSSVNYEEAKVDEKADQLDIKQEKTEPAKPYVSAPLNNNVTTKKDEPREIPQKKENIPEMEVRAQNLITAMLGNGCGLGNK